VSFDVEVAARSTRSLQRLLSDFGICIEQITATRSGTANAPGPAGPT